MKQSSIINPSRRIKQRLSLFFILAGLTLFGYVWAGETTINAINSNSDDPPPPTAMQDKDYSKFTHTNAYHSRMPCLLCHRRDTNSSRISFPGKAGHTPCIGCHQLQFSDTSSPIRTICHTNAQGALKNFPSLRSFGRKFDHSGHKGVNCSVCHKPAQRGVALSIPSGSSAHATCFQCHSASKPMTMSSCNVCHQLGRLVRTSQNAAAFRVNFSHERHSHAGLNCASCHNVRAGRTGQQVSKPLASMHFAPEAKSSCAACHNGQRAFGTNDFANCKRCHIGNSFKF